VTLRDAHYETGLPIETLRKWARRKHVPSEMRRTEYGDRRMVDLLAVEDRARSLGRPLHPVPEHLREPDAAEATGRTSTVGPEPDELEAGAAGPPRANHTGPTSPHQGGRAVDLRNNEDEEKESSRTAPPGTMIVPIAAWDRMLMQLGNLHEAGQQLAQARERAAKAETEATFLRERLAELRAQMEPAAGPERAPSPSAADDDAPSMWRYVMRGWRTRRKVD
jgi:DNA-binding transcriptional MerR regulator